MRAIIAPKEMESVCGELRSKGKTLGLVPTMGALHDGHLSLVRKSLNENEVTVVSIFINPLQFDKEEDLVKYPSTLDEDRSKLEAMGVDYVFQPDAEEFYPTKPAVTICFGNLEKILEGKFREGHFGGVGVVVSKLFHLIQPENAYFGLKDLQQFLLIRRMVQDLAFPLNVVGVETTREPSGLAMSSRNMRLSPEGKQVASNIYRGLNIAKEAILEFKDLRSTLQSVKFFYQGIAGLNVEYLEFVNGKDLAAIKSYDEISELAVCFAGYVEGVRLIDNLYLRLK